MSATYIKDAGEVAVDSINIVCDQHRKPYFVTRYERRGNDWQERPPASARQRREHEARPRAEGDDLAAAIANAAPTGKASTVWLAGDDPVTGRASTVVAQHEYQRAHAGALYRESAETEGIIPQPTPEQRTVHPNQCERCPANAPLRGEKLGPLLDGFAQLGRTRVSLRDLTDAAQRVRDTRK